MLGEDKPLKWVDTAGGPFLLLERRWLHFWEGVLEPSGGRVVHASFRYNKRDAPATDYDRACDVEEYLGLLEVGDGWGLILNDDSYSTAWQEGMGATDAGLFVRWVYAESDKDVLDALARIPGDVWEQEIVTFAIEEGPVYLFDASYDGAAIAEEVPEDCLKIDLPPGSYVIYTAHYKPNDETSLILHRFRREDNNGQ